MSDFMTLARAKLAQGKQVCVGLDSDLMLMPKYFWRRQVGPFPIPIEDITEKNIADHVDIEQTLSGFNRVVIDAGVDIAGAYKPNSAFYERWGVPGLRALDRTTRYIRNIDSGMPIILDVKRGDIGNTNKGYAHASFELYGAGAVTGHPYLGAEAMATFIDAKNKGLFVLCRTSNPKAGEFQDLYTTTLDPRAKPESMSLEAWYKVLCDDSMPLYKRVAYNVANKWNRHGNCMLVVGATYPDELRQVREVVGNDMIFLVPGIGAQGGDLEATVKAGGRNMFINSGRALIFHDVSEGEYGAAVTKATAEMDENIQSYLN